MRARLPWALGALVASTPISAGGPKLKPPAARYSNSQHAEAQRNPRHAHAHLPHSSVVLPFNGGGCLRVCDRRRLRQAGSNKSRICPPLSDSKTSRCQPYFVVVVTLLYSVLISLAPPRTFRRVWTTSSARFCSNLPSLFPPLVNKFSFWDYALGRSHKFQSV